ncbi:MAG: penicillin-binding transpeptidase domain-containing protein [Oscillospiraceae bacterium]|nr:penicillin-binding transpeptidase domain-containing protein [Oscillospiraceae bacterium]
MKKPISVYVKATGATLLVLSSACLCGYRLMKIQIVNSDSYISRQYSTDTYKQTIAATRGEIVDCNGEPIVQNTVGYNIIIEPDSFPKDNETGNEVLLQLLHLLENVEVTFEESLPISKTAPFTFTTDDTETLDEIRTTLNLNLYATAENCIDRLIDDYDIADSYTDEEKRMIAGIRYEMQLRGFSMSNQFTLVKDIPLEIVTEIKENGLSLPGVNIIEDAIRTVIQGDVIPHEIGTVGPIYAEEYEELAEQGYDLDDTVGKSGIEQAMESYLRGKDGTKTISVQDGTVVSSEITVPVEAGNTVRLTVDSTFQKDLQNILGNFIKNFDKLRDERTKEEGLGKVTSGALVVLDAEDGAVLGMATYPTYDLKDYSKNYDKLEADETYPLMNRATIGQYRPGSTFKTITATAGLNEGIVTGSSTYYCGHTYDYKGQLFGCTGSHGDISVVQALQYSCNIYFYKLSEELTIDGLTKYAELYGLGQPTGIETGDAAGRFANPETYAEYGWDWTVGHVLQAAIGQSETAVTPLQMAVVANTIANKGVRYQPHLVDSLWDYNQTELLQEIEPVIAETLPIQNDSVYSLIEQGMIAASVTNMPEQYSLANLGYDVAIKTGTPQAGGGRVQDSFFIGYAPTNNPKIAFACVVEGAEYSKYMIRDVLKAYERLEKRQETDVEKNTTENT